MSWVDVTTAVGTAGAAVVALGLGLRAEWRATRLERQQRGLDIQRQATQVAAWMIVERHMDEGGIEVDAGDPSLDVLDPAYDPRGVRVCVVVQNASDQPIWDVITHIPTFEPKNKDSAELKSADIEDERIVIGPGETIRIPIEILTIRYNRLPVEVEFRDNAGGEWRRDERGRLYRGRRSPASWAWIDDLAVRKKSDNLNGRPQVGVGSDRVTK
jgi:hypothetical protein